MDTKKGGAPDRTTLLSFLIIILIGGFNFVAVKFSNKELPPFYGAAVRFLIASLLLFVYVFARRIALPKGRSLVGALMFGLLGFAGAYALAYLSLTKLPVGVASVVMASVPLLTLVLAVVHRLERFNARGFTGALIAILGIAVLVGAKGAQQIPLLYVITMLGAAVCAAESGVIIKRFPPSNPFATNALAMSSGSLLLIILSLATSEHWTVPAKTSTWIAFAYLVTVGSITMFGLYLFTLKRWTASAVSYMFVLTPIVATLGALWLAKEKVTVGIAAGGIIVLIGVYVGALSAPKKKTEAAPEGCAPVFEDRLQFQAGADA